MLENEIRCRSLVLSVWAVALVPHCTKSDKHFVAKKKRENPIFGIEGVIPHKNYNINETCLGPHTSNETIFEILSSSVLSRSDFEICRLSGRTDKHTVLNEFFSVYRDFLSTYLIFFSRWYLTLAIYII